MCLKLTQHIGLFSLTTYFSFPDSCPTPKPSPGPHEAILSDLNISVSISFYCFTTHSKSEKKGLVTQSHPILWDPRDYSLPDSSVHGILQARILEWVAIPFSRGSSWSRDRTLVSRTAGRFFTICATREVTYFKQPFTDLMNHEFAGKQFGLDLAGHLRHLRTGQTDFVFRSWVFVFPGASAGSNGLIWICHQAVCYPPVD